MSISTKRVLVTALYLLAIFVAWEAFKPVPTDKDWETPMAKLPAATFQGDLVTVRDVRDFRYGATEADQTPGYYDQTYDLTKVAKVWFAAVPFEENRYAAHTFLSFEFTDGKYLAISIEARRTKGQAYDVLRGLLRTYPLMYVAADERDILPLRTEVRHNQVYLYPIRTEKPENARLLLEDMLGRMDRLRSKPAWYNTLWANCTSLIAWHVNRVSPGRVSPWSHELFVTAKSDELALQKGLLDTDLSIEEARKHFALNAASKLYRDDPDYSRKVREHIATQE